jgi:hypothetical protein
LSHAGGEKKEASRREGEEEREVLHMRVRAKCQIGQAEKVKSKCQIKAKFSP